MANSYITLFALKVLYAIYYKTTGKFACSSNRYLLGWAQYGTEAATTMNHNADAWFDENVVGARRNIDLGDQFTYQSGYNPQHGFFGLKVSFAKAFVVFGVIGPARDLRTLKPPLPFCPAILDAAKRVRKEKARRLSVGTERWSDAALKAGNRADTDPAFAAEVGAKLY